MSDHHGEHSNQCQEHAHSIPSHMQLGMANRRTACSLRRTTRQRRRSHELILLLLVPGTLPFATCRGSRVAKPSKYRRSMNSSAERSLRK